jgi:hypothetical protein
MLRMGSWITSDQEFNGAVQNQMWKDPPKKDPGVDEVEKLLGLVSLEESKINELLTEQNKETNDSQEEKIDTTNKRKQNAPNYNPLEHTTEEIKNRSIYKAQRLPMPQTTLLDSINDIPNLFSNNHHQPIQNTPSNETLRKS